MVAKVVNAAVLGLIGYPRPFNTRLFYLLYPSSCRGIIHYYLSIHQSIIFAVHPLQGCAVGGVAVAYLQESVVERQCTPWTVRQRLLLLLLINLQM